MQAKQKNVLKKTVDVCMTVLLLCLMAYQVTGEVLHEWLGVGMTVLLIIHHLLNIRWYPSLFRGKYNAYRAVTAAVNTLLLVSILLTALCGMAMSAHATPFLYGFLPVAFARRFHLAMSFWSFLLTGVHLGLHIPAMTAGIKWNGKASFAAAEAFTAVSGVGFWLFFKSGIPDYLFFRTPFAFLDYEKAAALVFLENLAILIAFAFIGAETASFLKAASAKGNARKFRTFLSLILVITALLIGAALLLCTGGEKTASPSPAGPAPQAETPGSAAPDGTSAPPGGAQPQPERTEANDGFLLLEAVRSGWGVPKTRTGGSTMKQGTTSPFLPSISILTKPRRRNTSA